jgi:hypothetical protein
MTEKPTQCDDCERLGKTFKPDLMIFLPCGVWFCDHCGNPQTDHPDGSVYWAGAA